MAGLLDDIRGRIEIREGIAVGGFAEYVVERWGVLEQDVKCVTGEVAALLMSIQWAFVDLCQITQPGPAQGVLCSGRNSYGGTPCSWCQLAETREADKRSGRRRASAAGDGRSDAG